jgi:monoamine oxidase
MPALPMARAAFAINWHHSCWQPTSIFRYSQDPLRTSTPPKPPGITRRELLSLVGKAAGGTAMYHAMSTLGFASPSSYEGPLKLEGAPPGQSILVLGAGIAGLVAAYELRKAGYRVKVLDYNSRAGGRAWTLRGGDEYTELGGHKQVCQFDPGLYLNPGPWRIPHHHYGVLDYAKRLGVALEPFMMVNYNAYLHSSSSYQGAPQRFGAVQADFHGHVAELLGKAVHQHGMDEAVKPEDQERLLEALREWGALDSDFRYRASPESAKRRGYEIPPGGGLMPAPVPSQPLVLDDILRGNLWRHLTAGNDYEYQTAIFQPVGGMDRIVMALYREVQDLVQLNSKVTQIDQSERGVTVTWEPSKGGAAQQLSADWCVCTIPLSILSQIEVSAQRPMLDAIHAVPYGPSVKVGLQFSRRFWEQDEQIYGGISFTDLPIQLVSYPSTGYGQAGKGVMLGGYMFGTNAYEFTAMAPADRVRMAVEYGTQLHPQYRKEFENGIAVGWHRVPWTQGCFGDWSDSNRAKHYDNLCAVDGRLVLAGEHASRIPAWQEGAVLSSLDAITRLHQVIRARAGSKGVA